MYPIIKIDSDIIRAGGAKNDLKRASPEKTIQKDTTQKMMNSSCCCKVDRLLVRKRKGYDPLQSFDKANHLVTF